MAETKKNKGFSSSMVTNVLLVVILFFMLIGACTNMSVNKKVNEIKTHQIEQSKLDMFEHDSLLVVKFQEILDNSLANLREDIKKDLDVSLYNFLIYEDDLDKGKISLSEIRNLLLEKKNEEGNENNKQ